MPWRNLPEWIAHLPDWAQWVMSMVAFLLAAGVGTVAKIADDVKSGDRDKFWTKQLYLEVPAVGMMALIGAGIAQHFELAEYAASALTAFLGWGGPKTITVILTAYAGGGKDRRK